jgi:hypothetical protein
LRAWRVLAIFIFRQAIAHSSSHISVAHCTSQSSSDPRVAAMNISFKIPSDTDVQCSRRIGRPSQPLYRISAQRRPCRLRGAGQPVPRGPQSM